jgi:L-lactate dehydrogenase complex protein LldE
MRVGLFIPCYVNQFFPEAAIASLSLLKKLGVDVNYPVNQTCCGQPMANAGFEYLAEGCNELFIDNFASFDYVVAPSASCILHVKEHLHSNEKEVAAATLRTKVFELVEFITDILKIKTLDAYFPYQVGLHQSCHGLRGLNLSQMSELNAPDFSKPISLLKMVKGLQLVPLTRPDECCGFGGTFSVSEEAVSVKMGKDRIADHENNGAQFITSSDLSCLMHMEGILKRKGSSIKILHIAEILNAEQ